MERWQKDWDIWMYILKISQKKISQLFWITLHKVYNKSTLQAIWCITMLCWKTRSFWIIWTYKSLPLMTSGKSSYMYVRSWKIDIQWMKSIIKEWLRSGKYLDKIKSWLLQMNIVEMQDGQDVYVRYVGKCQYCISRKHFIFPRQIRAELI